MRMNIRESGYEGKREIERGYKFTTCALAIHGHFLFLCSSCDLFYSFLNTWVVRVCVLVRVYVCLSS